MTVFMAQAQVSSDQAVAELLLDQRQNPRGVAVGLRLGTHNQ